MVIQGFKDPDALEGKLETSSPTASRLARHALLSIAATAHWPLIGADVGTVFLKGKPQQRELYARLPADPARMLGVDRYPYVKLDKPKYSQVDVPREWFREACRRIQLVSSTQHPLDPRLFMAHEAVELVGLVSAYVDDLLIAGDPVRPRPYLEGL